MNGYNKSIKYSNCLHNKHFVGSYAQSYKKFVPFGIIHDTYRVVRCNSEQIGRCPHLLLQIPSICFLLGQSSLFVVLVLVFPFWSKCFAVLIQGRNNQTVVCFSINESSFAFAFVTVSVIRVKRLAIAAFLNNVFFIIASCLWFLIIFLC